MQGSLTLRFLLFLPLLLGQILYAADYKIEGKIEGLGTGKIYLQEFYGEESYIIDSAFTDAENHFSFRINETKAPGQYRLIFSNRRFLDLIFNKENIKFSTSLTHLIGDMEILTSGENQLYYRYMKFRIKSQKRIDELRKQLHSYDEARAFYRELREEYKSLIAQEEEFTNQLIQSNPGLLTADFIRIDREPNPDPAWNAIQTNQWVFDHYPDYFLFSDTTLLRTNAVSAKIIAYLSVALSLHHHPDSLEDVLETASYRLLASTGSSEMMFHFMQQYLNHGFNRLNYPHIAALINEIPYPCCSCETIDKQVTHSKVKGNSMPAALLLKNNLGEKVKISLRKRETHLLFTMADCKWGDIMVKQLENKNQTDFADENQLIIYKEGETPTFAHSSSNVYFISDKNLNKIRKSLGLFQYPALITINREGKVKGRITSWLELM